VASRCCRRTSELELKRLGRRVLCTDQHS
jgi:hypothetical protein